MTSEEFLQLKALMQQNQRHLLTNQRHLERLVQHAERDRWYVAFGSDVAANVLTTAGFWLLQKLLAKR
jgi:hypothetical protein